MAVKHDDTQECSGEIRLDVDRLIDLIRFMLENDKTPYNVAQVTDELEEMGIYWEQ